MHGPPCAGSHPWCAGTEASRAGSLGAWALEDRTATLRRSGSDRGCGVDGARAGLWHDDAARYWNWGSRCRDRLDGSRLLDRGSLDHGSSRRRSSGNRSSRRRCNDWLRRSNSNNRRRCRSHDHCGTIPGRRWCNCHDRGLGNHWTERRPTGDGRSRWRRRDDLRLLTWQRYDPARSRNSSNYRRNNRWSNWSNRSNRGNRSLRGRSCNYSAGRHHLRG
jgi:hypothetical protein